MQTFLNAVYKNGTLILEKSLGTEKEGKKFKVLLYEHQKSRVDKRNFFNFVEKRSFKLPKNYKFNREELHER